MRSSAGTNTRNVVAVKQATALAHPNIALVKYWGKRDGALNLPAVGSISITLDTLQTTTRLQFDPTLKRDRFTLDGVDAADDSESARRVVQCLDRLRELAGVGTYADVQSENNFPTAAGLASSASGFAAIVVAADKALGLNLDRNKLSELARRGSGSAARSILGGFVELHHGKKPDGSDCVASALRDAADWPLAVTVGVISRKTKKISSTSGMEATRKTSPWYAGWVEGAESDLAIARDAIAARDFEKLATVSEHSCLKMHALALSARPGLLYWYGATVEGIHRVRELRAAGHAVFFTIDAGPQLKVVSEKSAVEVVNDALGEIAGVQDILHTGLGDGARVIA
ncbi:MAG: diphosphomevalonate decarboxylase [Gammaproteobacteria bacterium]|nr:diphosphomevalonate decarboxylase [Gammaproteobacteria bacterium]